MAAKSVIIAFKDGKLIKNYWTNIKECTKELELPYWSICRLKSPIKFNDFTIYRLPKNK